MDGTNRSYEDKPLLLRIPSETFYLDLARKFIIDLAQKTGFKQGDIDKIEMAVDEACANVIEHGYSRKIKKPYNLRRRFDIDKAIDLTVTINSNHMKVVISDQGKNFAFAEQGNIDLEDHLSKREIGGLGIYVIKTFMDEVSYAHIPGVGNELRLVKYKRNQF